MNETLTRAVELAFVCDHPEYKAKIGVDPSETLMVLFHEPEDGAPEDLAVRLANKLKQPTVLVEFDEQGDKVLAFARPDKEDGRIARLILQLFRDAHGGRGPKDFAEVTRFFESPEGEASFAAYVEVDDDGEFFMNTSSIKEH